MAYLEGLSFGEVRSLGTTRDGLPEYSGSAFGLSEWRFNMANNRRAVIAILDEDMRAQRLHVLLGKVSTA